MASKKKKKGRKNRGQNELAGGAWPTILAHGVQTFERGAAREAIGFFKQALKKGAPSEEVASPLFRAYLAREEQLRQKGMLQEADVVRRQAEKYQPPAQQLTADDLLAMAPGLGVEKLLASYLAFLKTNPPAAEVEHHIAGRMIISRQWNLLSGLDAELPLRRDAERAEIAAEDMYAGGWETAVERFKGLPRSSPYAPVGLFCRAMCAFYAEDDEAVARAVAMLPVDFPLYPLAQRLQKNPTDIAPLWQGSWGTELRIRALADSLEGEKLNQIIQKLKEAAGALLPEAPQRARRHLLELLYPLRCSGRLSDYQMERLVRANLDRDNAKTLFFKFSFFDFAFPLLDLVSYYQQLEKEFPGAEEALMARSLLILSTLERMETTSGFLWIPPEHIEIVRKTFGLPVDGLEELKIALNLAALELDPDNREGYERLAAGYPSSRNAKNLVEQGLMMMCDRFPDDPFPCLELATLYYGKNAFRKAEAVLAQAQQRAPHDRKVLERRLLSFLISAHQSLKRGKLHLAQRDLDLAKAQKSPALLFIIVEKQILFQLEQQGQLSLFDGQAEITPHKVSTVVTQALAPLSLFDRLKTLGYLALDSDERKDKWPGAVIREVHKLLSREIRRHPTLSSDQIIGLLKRPPREFEPLTGCASLVRYYLKSAKTFLAGVEDADIITAFDILVEARCFDQILTETRRRKRKSKGELRCLLAFYDTAVRHIKSPGYEDMEAFHSVVDSAQESWMETLRAAARRLSRHTDGPLQRRLATFDFSPQFLFSDDHPTDLPDLPFFDGDDDDDGVEDRAMPMLALLTAAELLAAAPSGTVDVSGKMYQEGIRESMEDFIRGNGLCGLPEEALLLLRRQMAKSDPHLINLILSLKNHLTRETIDALSPEAWAFFVRKD